jgi:hypothetical protein
MPFSRMMRIFPGMRAQRLMKPRIEPCAIHTQGPAHQCDGVVAAVLVHEGVLYSGSLAKYRAAFLVDPASLPHAAVANEGEEPRSWPLEAPSTAASICRAIPPSPTYKGCAPRHPNVPQHPERYNRVQPPT